MALNDSSKTATVIDGTSSSKSTNVLVVGSSSSVMQSFIMESSSTSTEDSSTSLYTKEKAEKIEQCNTAFQECLKKCNALSMLLQSGLESATEIIGMPQLWEIYEKLPWWAKTLIMIGTVSVVAVGCWGSWRLIRWLWPYFTSYIYSEDGLGLMSTLTLALDEIKKAGILDIFEKQLKTAVDSKDPASQNKDISKQTEEVKTALVSNVEPNILVATTSAILGFLTAKLTKEEELKASEATTKDKKSKTKQTNKSKSAKSKVKPTGDAKKAAVADSAEANKGKAETENVKDK